MFYSFFALQIFCFSFCCRLLVDTENDTNKYLCTQEEIEKRDKQSLISIYLLMKLILAFIKSAFEGDFPGSPVAKTLCSQCRGPRFNSCSELDPTYATTKSCMLQLKILHDVTNIKGSNCNI